SRQVGGTRLSFSFLVIVAACSTVSKAPTPDSQSSAAERPSTGPSSPELAAPRASMEPGTRRIFEDALAAAQKGDLTAAEDDFKEAARRDPKLDLAWVNVGVLAERRGAPKDAEKAYQKAVEPAPGSAAGWDYLTRLYCRTGRGQKIEETLRAHLQQAPDAVGARNALALALLQQNKHDAAAAEAKKVLKADERNVRAMQLLSLIY